MDKHYYYKARKYLLSFEEITPQMLDDHLKHWEKRKPHTIQEMFKAFLEHAKNRQGMPNSIGDIQKLSAVLFDFDHIRVTKEYTRWEDLFDKIKTSSYVPPGRMIKENNKSHWVIYCKAVISIADFLSLYDSVEDFQRFVDGFLLNEHSKLALPLLISKEIFGFGFALACDFLKENVSPEFVKPDAHLNDIARGLSITKSNDNYVIFKDVVAYSQAIGVLPYEIDKAFWLIGSGNFYLSKKKIRSSKEDFVAGCLSVENQEMMSTKAAQPKKTWPDSAHERTRAITEYRGGDFWCPDEKLHLKNCAGPYGYIELTDLYDGVLRIFDKASGEATLFKNTDELLNAGWVVD